jgi:hypothetical protein
LPTGEDFAESGRETPLDPADHYIANPRSTVVLLAQPSRLARSRVIELGEGEVLDRPA